MFSDNQILVIEDDPADFHLLEEGFRRGRIANRISHVSSAEDALAYLNGEAAFSDRERYPLPCLVLLDLKLQGASGFTVLEWIRQDPQFRKLPVVVFTSSKANADLERAYSLGANSYLVKPFDIGEFRALVKSIDAYWVLLAEKPRS